MLPSALNVRASIVLCCLLATPSEPALPPELRALQASLKQTRSVSAHFEQTRHWSALKDALVTQGQFHYDQGGRLTWHTNPPAESDLLLDGKTAVMSFPALKTQQTLDFSTDPGMGKVFETIRAVLRADLEQLQPLFSLSLVRTAPLIVSLKPRSAELARTLSHIRLEFSPTFLLTQVVLDEANGDRTELRFTGHQIVRAEPY